MYKLFSEDRARNAVIYHYTSLRYLALRFAHLRQTKNIIIHRSERSSHTRHTRVIYIYAEYVTNKDNSC